MRCLSLDIKADEPLAELLKLHVELGQMTHGRYKREACRNVILNGKSRSVIYALGDCIDDQRNGAKKI